MHLYFAYGSNLSQVQMRERCPGAVLQGVGVLRGYRLAFTRFSTTRRGGVADVVHDPGRSVWGLLYRLAPQDLKRLDQSEGYPHAYDRFQATIEDAEGRPISDVWVYAVVWKTEFVPPTSSYLRVIQRAAQEHGFPAEYQRALDYFRTADSSPGASSPHDREGH
jgi:gamma-glutamylcyclotransferase